MTELELLIDLHLRNARQGPGSDEATRRALRTTGLDRSAPLAIADLGCGTGASSLVLARETGADITSVDLAPAFVERVRERAEAAGMGDRITAVVGDIAEPPFQEGSLDAIWSEGAIYNIGFEEGLRAWRGFLRPGGVVAVSEITWTTDERPDEVQRYWDEAYPAIATRSEKRSAIERAGYELLDDFLLEQEAWAIGYYDALERGLSSFLERHAHSTAALAIVEAEQQEIELYRAFGGFYSYGFYIARRADG